MTLRELFAHKVKERLDEFLSHVRPEHRALAERKERIKPGEVPERMNSYEQRVLVPNYDNEALDKLKQTAAGFQRGQRVRIVRTSGAKYEGIFVRVRNEAVLHLAQVTIFNRLGGVVNSRDRSPRKFPLASVASIEGVAATC